MERPNTSMKWPRICLVAACTAMCLRAQETELSIQLMGEGHVSEIISYGGSSQDGGNGTVSAAANGKELIITGNAWKRLHLGGVAIVDSTILELDFASSSEGEIHGIGFDNDNTIGWGSTLQLHGTQVWGRQNFHNYDLPGGEYKHYAIPVGQYFTGNFDYLTFTMDHDIPSPDGESRFRNIAIYSGLGITSAGQYAEYGVLSYGGSGQDGGNGTATLADSGRTLLLNGNAWKRVDLGSVAVAPETVLEFDFASSSQGEIHGIGFDNDNTIGGNSTFKLYGTQLWGRRDFDDYDQPDGGYKPYQIPVGQYFTGTFRYLTFTMDHDVANPSAESVFSNIRIRDSDLPSWTGYDDATSSITSSPAILDLSTDISGMNLPRLTGGATTQHIPGGGYYGNGCMRFAAPYNGTEGYCGLGKIYGLRNAGDSTKVNIGFLTRFSQGYVDGHLQAGSYKHSILLRYDGAICDENLVQRPMMVTQPNTQTMVMCPAVGCWANTSDDPVNNLRPWNDWNTTPDYNLLGGVWLWIELQVNCNGPHGTVVVKTWDANGNNQGDEPLVMHMDYDDAYGGDIAEIDIIGSFYALQAQYQPDSWYELERVEIVVGDDSDMTPPAGFPGSCR